MDLFEDLDIFVFLGLTCWPIQVTVALVEQYIKPEEMVILCVIPAMSDFGNAEVGFLS